MMSFRTIGTGSSRVERKNKTYPSIGARSSRIKHKNKYHPTIATCSKRVKLKIEFYPPIARLGINDLVLYISRDTGYTLLRLLLL